MLLLINLFPISAFNDLNVGSKLKLVGLIQSSFSKHLQNLKSALSTSKNGFESSEWRTACEMYAVLINQAVYAAENCDKSKVAKTTKNNSVASFDWSHIRISLLENSKQFASLSLGRIFDSSTDRESIVTCLVKAAHKILENPENVTKSLNTRKAAIEVLSTCAKSQGYLQGLKTFIQQDLIYSEHLAEPVAELLKLLHETEDSGCAELVEDVLKSVGSQRFNSQESATSTKSAAIFFAKFTSICPKESLHSLSLFIDQLDSESYVVRMSMVEVIGVLIYYLMTQEDRSESVKAQTKSLFSALEERFHDVNSFVRSKTLQVCCDLAKSSSIPITKRPRLLELAAERVMDKSSNVRRKAIQLLGDFLKTHPFGVDGGELNLSFFKSRLADIERLLNELAPSASAADDEDYADKSMDFEGLQLEEDKMKKTNDNSAKIGSLLAQKQYYCDAIKFVTLINNVIPTICLLLSSTTKTEVFDVMEFLVDAHIYKLESSEAGIKKMLHLIWERELSSEDGTKQSFKEHLIESYRRIYLYADESLPVKERHVIIARSLVSMVEGISIAELASLTELFSSFVKKNLISEPVIQQIFNLFTSNDFDKRSRRSALIIISILAKSKREIVEKRLESLLKLGLGSLGQCDPLIAQYTLIALQSLNTRIPSDNVLFTRIINFINSVCNSSRWHPVINQGITTIFLLADRPSLILAELLKEQSREVFQSSAQITSKNQLGKLLLMIGQVAACFADHLDVIEKDGKESAQKLDKSDQNNNDDLAKVSASAEDDFTELIKTVREHEVLFGPDSIFTTLSSLVVTVCSNNTVFSDAKIQRIATLAFAKLMTISSIFCERNLQLFLTILERSTDPVIRSNLIIGFGDLAQVFNRLVDQNIDYLFNRLRDDDLIVRRNTLMVLTHLSLCGMIKVKGQIGEIAKCLIDSDLRIRNLARIFFSEMAERDSGTIGGSGIYNHLPDILSHLSGDRIISEEEFRLIMKFIFEFIKKEKQMENLIEKLCSRFRNSDELRHSRDLAYCLSLISFSGDRSLKKLVESFPLYQDKLVDEIVLGSFVEIVQRSKKFCKSEMKPLIDEFEGKLIQAANRDGKMEQVTFASLVTKQKTAGNSGGKKTGAAAAANKKQAARKKKQRFDSDDLEDDDEEEDDVDVDEIISTQKSTQKQQPRRPAPLASSRPSRPSRSVVVEEDDSSSSSEEELVVKKKPTATAAAVKNKRKKIVDSDEEDCDEDDIF